MTLWHTCGKVFAFVDKMVYICLVGMAFLLAAASPCSAQWDRMVVISPDSFYNGWPQIVVDDSFRLHVFCARGLNGMAGLPSSLFYLKFDSWGNLLSGPTELWPGNHYSDYSPGVLLDRNGVIHLVWSRSSNWPVPPQVIYARLNTNGEFLTPPTVIDTTGCVQNGMNLVQNVNGDVWAVGESHMAAFHENGELFVPFQPIFPPESDSWALHAIAGVAPDGSIYAAMRYWSPGDTQSIAVTRLDTAVRVPIIIMPGTSPYDPVQMGVGAFFVDFTRAMHFILGRDDHDWKFYQRNSPDGGPVDTLRIMLVNQLGGYSTYFKLVGDTLVYIFDGRTQKYRAGFYINGTWALTPTPFTDHQLTIGSKHFAWKEGSYWIVGLLVRPNDAHSIAMIHVPGPNEPPNAVRDRTAQASQPPFSVTVSPNPGQDYLRLELSGIVPSRCVVRLFNVLGQQVASREFDSLPSSTLVFPLPANLPAGSYFGEITAGQEVLRFTFIHL